MTIVCCLYPVAYSILPVDYLNLPIAYLHVPVPMHMPWALLMALASANTSASRQSTIGEDRPTYEHIPYLVPNNNSQIKNVSKSQDYDYGSNPDTSSARKS